MAEELSAKEAARELGVDARTFRKFMRATLAKEDQPGQGNRYHISSKDMKKLRKRFEEWRTPRPGKKAKTNGAEPEVIEDVPKKPKKQRKSKDPEVADLTDDLGMEELDLSELEGPSDDELLEINLDDIEG